MAGASSIAASSLNDGYAEIVCGRGAEKVLESAELSRIEDDDIELILFRVPAGFDASALDGVELSAGADEIVVGDGGRYAMRQVPLCEAASYVPAFPSREQGRWVGSQPFAAQYSLVMRPPGAGNRAPLGPAELPPVPQLQGLRLRHPFKGGQLPLTSSARGGPAATPAATGAATAQGSQSRAGADKSKKQREEGEAGDKKKKKKKDKKDKAAR